MFHLTTKKPLKTVSEVLSVFTKTIEELRLVEASQAEEANVQTGIIAEASTKREAAMAERDKAATAARKIEQFLAE